MSSSPHQSPDLADDVPEGDLVTISRWELDALRSMASAAAPQAMPEPPAPIEPAAGRLDPIVREDDARDRKSAELERAYRAAIRDRELATALAGRDLVPGAAAQLIKLWREEFDVHEEAGELRVTSRDGRPVAKAVEERLGEAEYAHFRPTTSRGGAAVRGPGRTATPPAAAAPRTLGEAALLRWREAAAVRPDPSAGPIGLRRR